LGASVTCQGCRNGDAFPIDFTMAFHPIIDVTASEIWGYEALVRGTAGESAHQVLSMVNDTNRYAFDQACRVKAIALAGAKLKSSDAARLSINFMPNAVYEPMACIQASLKAAREHHFNPKRIMFEFTENEEMTDTAHVNHIIATYKHIGFMTALDDFGAGFAGLNLLAQMQPDLIKIDMQLIRGLDSSPARIAIVSGIISIAQGLGLSVIAEGVETEDECAALRSLGITLFQGFLFAKPEIETFAVYDELIRKAA
jgi:EAL domain-containing protein (putative c-di-GMP-specific phosphodiesterase class I)